MTSRFRAVAFFAALSSSTLGGFGVAPLHAAEFSDEHVSKLICASGYRTIGKKLKGLDLAKALDAEHLLLQSVADSLKVSLDSATMKEGRAIADDTLASLLKDGDTIESLVTDCNAEFELNVKV